MYAGTGPLVLPHARALPAAQPPGVPAATPAPGCASRARSLTGAARALDFTWPAALMPPGVLHRICGTGQAQQILSRLTAPPAPGSFLVISHSASAVSGAAMEQAAARRTRPTHPDPPEPAASADRGTQPAAITPPARILPAG